MPEIDIGLANALDRASIAKTLADSYLKMARVCDWNAATRWHERVKDALERAELQVDYIPDINPPPPDDHAIYIDSAKRTFELAKKAYEEAERLFRVCAKPRGGPRPLFRFENLTAFDLPEIGHSNLGISSTSADEITLGATIRGDCPEPCFVSVYSFETADTGERVDPPSKADKRFTPQGNPALAPKDVDSFEGFVVDAPPNHSSPCWPHSTYDANTKKLSALDAPNVVREGYLLSFETCAVCIEDGQVTVLGCMRWTVDSTNKITTNLQHLGQSPQPSPPFERALKHWLNRRAP